MSDSSFMLGNVNLLGALPRATADTLRTGFGLVSSKANHTMQKGFSPLPYASSRNWAVFFLNRPNSSVVSPNFAGDEA